MPSNPETAKPDHHHRRVLVCLSEHGGWTAGEIARQMGYTNARRHGQIIRRELLRMESVGWVGRLDDNAPVAWVRTPLGTEMMNG
jgi:predicted ArsR family transcriptional regulator